MSDIYAENMSRDADEAKRLDEQFDLMTQNIGYLLHPDVASALPPSPRVADVGTGTGIFLQRLQTSHPNATLDGYDISPAMFPPPQQQQHLPNMSLRVLDVKQPIPPELQGAYDLVHVRLLAAAMLPAEWGPVVRNVARLLKPGGWLQWEECDFAHVRHLRGRDGSRVDTARRMGRAFRDALHERFEHGWDTLADDMRAAGLGRLVEDVVSSDRLPESRERMTANGMEAIFKWAQLVAHGGNVPGLPTPGDELRQAERHAFADIESGCYTRFDIHIACGQRTS
ncbi:S-adenosyl-L-methionine-dependent methyltransferase [Staphylotrichum tortipilum]|uniref:S-adenosyl-L-methionine-dependent methyltransferase n=1 Tax=Staphylotrichum tortipilum TaxID=2831512 RepID=A0AAN6RU36_9PEZI|nr:S-adenosyl-L-methionine-dependent methyltransferase [Staphylotrichum longicolle]